MSFENRTEALQAFRDISSGNNRAANRYIASPEQLSQYLDRSLECYSVRQPVEGNEVTLVVTAGSRDVPLAGDWLKGNLANEAVLQAIEDRSTSSGVIISSSPSINRFDPINKNLSQPLKKSAPYRPRPDINKGWVNGELLPIFKMRMAVSKSGQYSVQYYAIHRIEDATDETSSICTVDEQHHHVILQCMLGFAVQGKAFEEPFNQGNIAKLINEGEAIINAALSKVPVKNPRK